MTDRSQPSTPDDSAVATALRQLFEAAQPITDDPTGIYTIPAQGPDTPAYTIEITAASTDSAQTTYRVSYCLDCEWRVSTADHPADEVSTQMLYHALETGHDIESTERPAHSASDDD